MNESKKYSNSAKGNENINSYEYLKMCNDIEGFFNQLPNPILRRLDDEFYTIEFLNDKFLELTGYSSNDIKEIFNNNYIEIIYCNDQNKVVNEIKKQLEDTNTYEVEYRIVHKSGKLIWVRDKGSRLLSNKGAVQVYCTINNILKYNNLGINENYYSTIMEKSGDSMYIIDFKNNNISFSDNFINKFGKEVLKYKNIQDVLNSDLIYNDDLKICDEIINDIKHGEGFNENYNELEIRIKNKNEEYIWCLIKFYVLRDLNKNILKNIGIIADINEVKKESNNLHILAERNLLTGLYNKVTSQNLIEEYIGKEKDNICALFVIDLDNFKEINDRLGHLFGDSVLIEVSAEIKNAFEKNDIVGRVGGDEFTVFMKNVNTKDMIIEKAKLLLQILNRSYKGRNSEHQISGSIGISIYPNNGKTYKEIFQKADTAAYYSKQEGKNCYHFYSDSIGEFKYISTSRKEFSEIDSEKRKEDNFPKYIFEILYETEDINAAMQRILSLTARYFNIDHICIFEYDEEKNRLEKTYEYCKKGITPASDYSLIYDSLDYSDYIKLYDVNGVFYCNDIERLPENIYNVYKKYDVCSVLKSMIVENGDFKGFIGFSEDNRKRQWTKSEVEANIFVSKIISIFLLKKRKETQIKKLNDLFQFMLENTTTYNYVIEKDTYEIIYLNHKTKNLYKGIKTGEKCYRAIKGLNYMCPDCPTKKLVDGTRRAEVNYYNKESNLYMEGIILLAEGVTDKDVYIVVQNAKCVD